MGAVFFLGFAMIGIAIAVILIGLFLIGMIFLTVGIVRKRNPKNAGKRSPVVCIVFGVIFLLPPVGTVIFLVVSLLSGIFGSVGFDHVTDGWRSGRFMTDDRAKEEAIHWLLTAADAGDRDYFEKMFTPNLQKKGNFGDAIDAFFESYPNGLSLCKPDGGYGSSRHDSGGWWASTWYTCFLDGEWYYMRLEICYQNPESPDDVGVTFFCIENLEAYALDRDYRKDDFVACRIVDESKVTARLINGRGYVFTPTPDRSITVEEMKAYLKKYNDLDDLAAQIGEPNVYKDSEISTGDDYFYELVPENGEPRYMYICAERSGKIDYHYVCTEVGQIPN